MDLPFFLPFDVHYLIFQLEGLDLLGPTGTGSPTTFQEKEKRREGQQRKCLKTIDGVFKQRDMLCVCRDTVMDVYSDRYRYGHLVKFGLHIFVRM